MEFSDIQPGHGVKTKGGKYYKVTKILNDQEIECVNCHPNEPDKEVPLSVSEIVRILTPHQIGQVKRFLPGGTGFSRLGRKLQKDHTREAAIESFMNKEIDGSELLEQVNQRVEQDVLRALQAFLTPDEKKRLDRVEGEITRILQESLEDYKNSVASGEDCSEASEESARALRRRLDEEHDLLEETLVRPEDIKEQWVGWWKNSLHQLWCPN